MEQNFSFTGEGSSGNIQVYIERNRGEVKYQVYIIKIENNGKKTMAELLTQTSKGPLWGVLEEGQSFPQPTFSFSIENAKDIFLALAQAISSPNNKGTENGYFKGLADGREEEIKGLHHIINNLLPKNKHELT